MVDDAATEVKPAKSGLGADTLYGAQAIADEIGVPLRKCFYLLEQGRIPAGKLGREYVGSRSALRDHFARLARGEAR